MCNIGNNLLIWTHLDSSLFVFSEALGHENPVFLGGSPQTKTRTVSQIMTRQNSETGRHLLSEPGTPLSPPAHGDVFFPIEGRTLTQNYTSTQFSGQMIHGTFIRVGHNSHLLIKDAY